MYFKKLTPFLPKKTTTKRKYKNQLETELHVCYVCALVADRTPQWLHRHRRQLLWVGIWYWALSMTKSQVSLSLSASSPAPCETSTAPSDVSNKKHKTNKTTAGCVWEQQCFFLPELLFGILHTTRQSLVGLISLIYLSFLLTFLLLLSPPHHLPHPPADYHSSLSPLWCHRPRTAVQSTFFTCALLMPAAGLTCLSPDSVHSLRCSTFPRGSQRTKISLFLTNRFSYFSFYLNNTYWFNVYLAKTNGTQQQQQK